VAAAGAGVWQRCHCEQQHQQEQQRQLSKAVLLMLTQLRPAASSVCLPPQELANYSTLLQLQLRRTACYTSYTSLSSTHHNPAAAAAAATHLAPDFVSSSSRDADSAVPHTASVPFPSSSTSTREWGRTSFATYLQHGQCMQHSSSSSSSSNRRTAALSGALDFFSTLLFNWSQAPGNMFGRLLRI
jgi:hypothetical protein